MKKHVYLFVLAFSCLAHAEPSSCLKGPLAAVADANNVLQKLTSTRGELDSKIGTAEAGLVKLSGESTAARAAGPVSPDYSTIQIPILAEIMKQCPKFTDAINSCYSTPVTGYNSALGKAAIGLTQICNSATLAGAKDVGVIKGRWSAVTGSRELMLQSQAIARDILASETACRKIMEPSGVNLCSANCDLGTIQTKYQEATGQDLTQFPEALTIVQTFANDATTQCISLYVSPPNGILSKYAEAGTGALQVAGSSGQTWKSFRNTALIGGAVVGGAVVMHQMSENKKEKEQEKERKEKFENALVKGADGAEINCKTVDTYQRAECKDALLNYCSKPEHSKENGCQMFSGYQCTGEASTSGYCMHNMAKNYCASGGANAANSPACVWVNSRPITCAKNPDSAACLSSMTPAEMDKACVSYPADPLCQKHNAGNIVTAPSEGNAVPRGAGAIGNGSDVASQGSTSLASLVSGNSGTDPGGVIPASMWQTNSSKVQALCANRIMVGCK